MILVGLTGNFGMGKSLVLNFFHDLGAATISSDQIVHGLLCKKKVIDSVVHIFGAGVRKPDGSLDRKMIANAAFRDEKLRAKLERVLHPLVFIEIDCFLAKLKGLQEVVVVEVPLLFEGDHHSRFDKTVTVFCTQKTALNRLARSGVSRRDALGRLRVQTPIRIKKKLSDYVIDNNGVPAETRKQVKNIYRQLKKI